MREAVEFEGGPLERVRVVGLDAPILGGTRRGGGGWDSKGHRVATFAMASRMLLHAYGLEKLAA